MWTLLSFTGRFDVAFLEASIAKAAENPTSMPGERTPQQKQLTRNAQIARARLRQGKMLDRLDGNTTIRGLAYKVGTPRFPCLPLARCTCRVDCLRSR